jgi:hypothetical protein
MSPADRGDTYEDVGLRPYRQLAVRVLARALLDLDNPAGSAADRESARVFLTGSSMLFHWCRVAALDPSSIIKHAARAYRTIQ